MEEGTAPLPMLCMAEETAREKTAGSAVGVRLGAELAISDDISDAEPAPSQSDITHIHQFTPPILQAMQPC